MKIGDILSKKMRILISGSDKYCSDLIITKDDKIVYSRKDGFDMDNFIKTEFGEIEYIGNQEKFKNLPQCVAKIIYAQYSLLNIEFKEYLDILSKIEETSYRVLFHIAGYMVFDVIEDGANVVFTSYEEEGYIGKLIPENEALKIIEGKTQFQKATDTYYNLTDEKLYMYVKNDDNVKMVEIKKDETKLSKILFDLIED